MNKGRLEAFSNGVFAIIITIMALDLKAPSLEALRSALPVFLSYVLSFIYVGIYWNNPHHLLHASEQPPRRERAARKCSKGHGHSCENHEQPQVTDSIVALLLNSQIGSPRF